MRWSEDEGEPAAGARWTELPGVASGLRFDHMQAIMRGTTDSERVRRTVGSIGDRILA